MPGVIGGCVTQENDLYALLGCNRSAYQSDIRKGFRLWGIRHHPRKGGEEHHFTQVCNAYEVLGNEDLKDIVDRYGLEGLGWDSTFRFNDPKIVFQIFYKFFGGSHLLEPFLNIKNNGTWDSYTTFFEKLSNAMPKLTCGMSCCGDFLPVGELHQTIPSKVLTRHDSVQSATSFYTVMTPAPSSRSLRSAVSVPGTTKDQFMNDYRRKTSSNSISSDKSRLNGTLPSTREVSYELGMPAKEAALDEYRRRSSTLSSISRTSLYDMRREQRDEMIAEEQTREQWLNSFRDRKTSMKNIKTS